MTEMTDERALDFIRTYLAPYAAHGEKDLVVEHIAARLRAAPQPPAEAQPVACAHEAWEEGAGWNRCVDCGHGWAPTSPPSAPVGVGAVRDALRKAFRFGETHWQQADSEHTSQHRKADETMATFKAWADETAAALAKQPAAVDEAMVRKVAKAINAELEGEENFALAWQRLGSNERRLRDRMARAAIAAIAAQQGDKA